MAIFPISPPTSLVAIDTEAMGLDPNRDRLCVVQLSPGDGSADVVQIARLTQAPNIERLLADKLILKIFHFARFDLGMLAKTFGVMARRFTAPRSLLGLPGPTPTSTG